MCVSQELPPLAEMSKQGEVFIVSTPVAGVAPGTALSTTPPMCLWNPPNSGVRGIVLASSLGYVSGTLGAGSVVYARVASQQTKPSTGTELFPVCTNMSDARGAITAHQGSTVSATPTILRAAYILGAGLATTAELPKAPAKDEIAGEFIIEPGTCFVMQGVAAAGTSPLVLIGVTWHEEPYLN
jgi:hypothetical protein